MKGWTEEEFRNKNLMAPCGLYFGLCGVYIATRDGNEKFKAIMGNLYGLKPEENVIEEFNISTGLRVMKRTIPIWRAKVAEHGDEKGSIEWAQSECERYHCSSCGEPLSRGAQL